VGIRSLKTASISTGVKRSKVWDQSTVIVNTDFESIATVTVGAGGQSSVTFSSIPSTFKHLQIRWNCITNRGTYAMDDIKMTFNGDAGANYSSHRAKCDHTSFLAGASINQNYIYYDVSAGTSVSNFFGAAITDVLDYASTNIHKTTRAFTGTDVNGAVAGETGRFGLQSGNWRSTSAINSITIAPLNGTQFNQHSSFALYGIK
jgi:hypothetical protein